MTYPQNDADWEMYELEQTGNYLSRLKRKMLAAYDAGNLKLAAQNCLHGWTYPLNSPAAEYEGDPRLGQKGNRCCTCGSAILGGQYEGFVEIISPCEIKPHDRRWRKK